VSGLTIPTGKFGIVVEFNSHADIYASSINHLAGTAIYLQHDASATITGNRLEGNLNNVGVAFNSSAVLDANSIRAASNVGVFIGRMSTVILVGNTITQNTGGGVLLQPDYALVAAVDSPNTIELNGNSDVICEDKGIYQADTPRRVQPEERQSRALHCQGFDLLTASAWIELTPPLATTEGAACSRRSSTDTQRSARSAIDCSGEACLDRPIPIS